VYKALSHYPNNWVEARKDIQHGKEASRIMMQPWMHAVFKGLASQTLRSECIALCFKRVQEGQGHHPYMFEDQSSLGTWSTGQAQVNSAPCVLIVQLQTVLGCARGRVLHAHPSEAAG
jgi:hypothetical protein